VLEGVAQVQIDADIVAVAAGLEPVYLRSLDAIHVASALALGDSLAALVTYDRRMQDACTAAGIPWAAPA
jgi:uncharacterized protein